MQKISLHQLLPGPGTQTCKWYKRTTGHVSYTAVRGATFVVLQLTTQACEVIAHTSFEKADLVLPSQLPPNDHTSNIVLLSIWLSAAELAHKWCMDRVEACFNSKVLGGTASSGLSTMSILNFRPLRRKRAEPHVARNLPPDDYPRFSTYKMMQVILEAIWAQFQDVSGALIWPASSLNAAAGLNSVGLKGAK